MRILFVVRDMYLFERFGIMYISSVLKRHGHEVGILRTISEDIDSKMRAFKPHVLAYSITTGPHKYYLNINREIKKKYEVFSIFGGPHPTFFPEMINEVGVDAICVGEGEMPMLNLAEALSKNESIGEIENLVVKQGDQVKHNDVRALIEDLDTIPFPDRELIYKGDLAFSGMRVKAFFSGRGCPYKCTYCFNHRYNELFRGKGKVIRKRSVDNILEEILEVKNRYPLDVVRFMDDVFILGGKAWLEEFSHKYRKKINLPFVCMARADLIDEDNVKLLKEAGCHSVYTAIEAGNDHIRNDFLKRNLTKDKMMESSRLCHRMGIRVVAENMIGLPSETIDDMLETLNLNIKCGVDLPITSIFTPYPGTELAKISQEKKYFSGDYDKINFSFFGDSPLNFTKNEKKIIRNLRNLFSIAVGFPFLLPLIKLLIKLPSNRIFGLIGDTWHAYCLKFRIFPHSLTLKEYCNLFSLFLKRNKV